MKPEEYKILKHIDDAGGKCPISYYDTLSEVEKLIFNDMCWKLCWVGYADGVLDMLGGMGGWKSIIITDEGKKALLEESHRREEARQQAEKDAADKTEENRMRHEDIVRSRRQLAVTILFDIFLVFLGWLLGRLGP